MKASAHEQVDVLQCWALALWVQPLKPCALRCVELCQVGTAQREGGQGATPTHIERLCIAVWCVHCSVVCASQRGCALQRGVLMHWRKGGMGCVVYVSPSHRQAATAHSKLMQLRALLQRHSVQAPLPAVSQAHHSQRAAPSCHER